MSAQSYRPPPVVGLDEYFPVPDDNPITDQKIALGRRLFFDPVLSRDYSQSCATCHQPQHAFSDTRALSRGVRGRNGRRNAPAIINRAYGSSFFWDGRAESLEAQVLQPIADSLEMDLPVDELVTRLSQEDAYRRVFGREFTGGVSSANIAKALAAYIRTIRSGDSPIDRYRLGDSAAIGPDARRGYGLFFGKARCSLCHTGSNFTDEKFHNTGVAVRTSDVGRLGVSHDPADRGAFKTPTLRNVALTGPYMHDGSLSTLRDVIDFYDRGGRANPALDPDIRRLQLSAVDKKDILAFLRALTSRATVPPE